MHKLVAIVYSVLILTQSFNFSLEDLSKLNTLMAHAEFHQERYGDSFSDFISEHYGDAKFHHETEHEEHEDLPFKHQHCCTHIALSFTLPNVDFTLDHPMFIEIPCNFFYKESISLFEKPSVFQPPKFA